MIFEGVQSQILRFKFHFLGSKFQKKPGIQPSHAIILKQNKYDPFKCFFKYFLGGDEVGYGCWQSNPNITAWMKENNVTTYQKLEEYWVKNILDISKKQNFGTDWENFKILKLKTDNMKWTLAKCVTFLTWSFRYLSHLDNLNPIFHVFSRTLS